MIDAKNITLLDDMDVIAKVLEAINVIRRGVCKRVDVSERVKVYECKNIIRIDIKQETK